jgi:hypothetical protein
MRTTVRIAALLFTFALGSIAGHRWRTSPTVFAQAVPNETAAPIGPGRYELFRLFYNSSQEGTAMIDTQTGRVWVINYNAPARLQELPGGLTIPPPAK